MPRQKIGRVARIKRSVSLDADLVAWALSRFPTLSGAINAALEALKAREEADKRDRI